MDTDRKELYITVLCCFTVISVAGTIVGGIVYDDANHNNTRLQEYVACVQHNPPADCP